MNTLDIIAQPASTLSDADVLWNDILAEVEQQRTANPVISSFLDKMALQNGSMADAAALLLGSRMGSAGVSEWSIRKLCQQAYQENPELVAVMVKDLLAIVHRDPASYSLSAPFLFFKGFHALQAYRVARHFWMTGQQFSALALQSAAAAAFGVDIHPAARIGAGVMIDHATGVVIGETAVIGDNVSILHNVTLGGSGRQQGDRHPKVGSGVLIGAGATLLGNIRVGDNARIGAGAVALRDVPQRHIATGIPARNRPMADNQEPPALTGDQSFLDDFGIDYMI